jgi:serine/threonine protein kinase
VIDYVVGRTLPRTMDSYSEDSESCLPLLLEIADALDRAHSQERTRSAVPASTPAYMAPEQIADGTADHYSNRYSLAVTERNAVRPTPV